MVARMVVWDVEAETQKTRYVEVLETSRLKL